MARLLFFTPVSPAPTGQGTAIRAGIALEVLSEEFEVTVVLAGHWSGKPSLQESAWIRTHADACHFVPVPPPMGAAQQLVSQHLSQSRIDGAYVFRLAAAPLALQVVSLLQTPGMFSILDLDDDECTRTEKFIQLREKIGDLATASRERADLERQRKVQRMLLSRFDLCFLAAPEDRDSLAARYPDRRFACLPNVVRIPGNVVRIPGAAPSFSSGGEPDGQSPFALTARRQSRPASLLFLGKLDYLPNEDAVLFFCRSILPLLRTALPDVTIRVAGIDPTQSIRQLSLLPGVTIVGAVADVAPEYERARIMVAPLRAGSGTRIKILEAFSFGLPVVSTTVGAAGLGVVHGVHLLIADTPDEFAAACLRLLEDESLAATLARNAYRWLRETHSLDTVRAILHGIFPAS